MSFILVLLVSGLTEVANPPHPCDTVIDDILPKEQSDQVDLTVLDYLPGKKDVAEVEALC
jgi:hypothetical protein